MDNKIKIFIAVIVVLIFGTLAMALTRSSGSFGGGGGKYDEFATCLKDKGVVFYGAFWCPHCAAQEKLLEASRSKLETLGLYKECSTPDAGSQTELCIAKKIRSYPTWSFPEALNITSTEAPHKCTDSPDESDRCKQAYNTDFASFIFPDFKNNIVASVADPVEKDGVWTFVPDSRITGEVELSTLSEQTGCVLPAEE